jgi:hypothetical protein
MQIISISEDQIKEHFHLYKEKNDNLSFKYWFGNENEDKYKWLVAVSDNNHRYFAFDGKDVSVANIANQIKELHRQVLYNA